MKRNEEKRTSKQILRALTVGISASMLLNPIAAMADELGEGNTPENDPIVNPTDAATLDEIAVSANEAKTEVSNLEEELTSDVETLELMNSSMETSAFDEVIADANSAEEFVATAEDKLEATNDDLEKMKSWDVSENAAMEVAEENVSDIETIVKTVSDNMAAASDRIDADIENIKNANTSAEAENAKAAVDTEVANATTELENAKQAVVEKKAAFEAAKEAAQEAQEAYDEALKNAKDNSAAALEALENANAEAAKSKEDLAAAKADLLVFLKTKSAYSYTSEAEAREKAVALGIEDATTDMHVTVDGVTYCLKKTDVTSVNETRYEAAEAYAEAGIRDANAKNEHEYSHNHGNVELSQSGSIDCDAQWHAAGHYTRVLGVNVWVPEEIPHFEYVINGTVTVEYAETTNEKVSYATFWQGVVDFFAFWKEDKIDEIAAQVKAQIEAQGGQFVAIEGWNWDAGTATVYYVAPHSITVSGDFENAAAAQNAANNAVNNDALNNGGAAYNVNIKTSNVFAVSGELSSEIFEGKTNEEVSAIINAIKEFDTSNSDRYIDAWAGEAMSKLSIYNAANSMLSKAMEDVEAAKQDVEVLANAIADLEAHGVSVGQKIEDLYTRLEAAEATLSEKENDLEDLKKKQEEAGEELQKKLDELNKPVNNNDDNNDDNNNNNNDNNEEQEAPEQEAPAQQIPVVQAPVQQIPVVQAPVQQAPVVEEPEVEAPEVVIEEEPVAEAPAPVVEEEPEVEEEVVVIPEEETPEAPSIPDEKGMNWWWLLIVLVLGTAGAEMYRRHQKKVKAAKGEDNNKNM